eukprot:Nk52_evm19s317 gene=Nk52_evmTU19s317
MRTQASLNNSPVAVLRSSDASQISCNPLKSGDYGSWKGRLGLVDVYPPLGDTSSSTKEVYLLRGNGRCFRSENYLYTLKETIKEVYEGGGKTYLNGAGSSTPPSDGTLSSRNFFKPGTDKPVLIIDIRLMSKEESDTREQFWVNGDDSKVASTAQTGHDAFGWPIVVDQTKWGDSSPLDTLPEYVYIPSVLANNPDDSFEELINEKDNTLRLVFGFPVGSCRTVDESCSSDMNGDRRASNFLINVWDVLTSDASESQSKNARGSLPLALLKILDEDHHTVIYFIAKVVRTVRELIALKDQNRPRVGRNGNRSPTKNVGSLVDLTYEMLLSPTLPAASYQKLILYWCLSTCSGKYGAYPSCDASKGERVDSLGPISPCELKANS